MEHKHAPRLLIVDITAAEKIIREFEQTRRCNVSRSLLLDHTVDYLNKPIHASGALSQTAKFLAEQVIEPRIKTNAQEFEQPEELSTRISMMIAFLSKCDRIFRENGLYVNQRLHYVYNQHQGTSRLVLEKRRIPIY